MSHILIMGCFIVFGLLFIMPIAFKLSEVDQELTRAEKQIKEPGEDIVQPMIERRKHERKNVSKGD